MSAVIRELRALQARYGFLPAEELRALAARLQVPLSQLHGVASFFPHFRLDPPASVEVRVCVDMACHLLGAERLRAALEREGARVPGATVQPVSCLGRCDRAPAVAVNDVILEAVAETEAGTLLQAAANGHLAPRPRDATSPPILRADPYGGHPRYEAVARYLAAPDPEGLLATLKASGLRGLGGAGFPTADKWRIVRQAPGDPKYVVCNADESEPGTFKDRFIMETAPHLVVEGMVLAGLVTGAREGYVYLRHEYGACEQALERALRDARQQGILGPQILGSDRAFDIELFVSPGGYICGEESALLEAMEGKRAEPRNKPPFPGTQGLHGRPTVVNNVETLALVPLILLRGAEWFRAQGRHGGAGLKFVGVSGHVRRPGVYEVPMGLPARELIFDLAGGLPHGRRLKAWAPSGPSAGYLPASLVDVPLEWDALARVGSMLGSGAVVVVGEGTCMLDMALNAVRFFRNESCGKCVPCRVGTQKLVELLTRVARGRGTEPDLESIADLDQALRLASICGLGQVAAKPVTSVLAHFREEVEDHVRRRRCPEGTCPTAGPADEGEVSMTIVRRL